MNQDKNNNFKTIENNFKIIEIISLFSKKIITIMIIIIAVIKDLLRDLAIIIIAITKKIESEAFY